MQQALDFGTVEEEIIPPGLQALWLEFNPLSQVIPMNTEPQILDAVVELMKQYPMDMMTETKSTEDKKWLLVSGLQKAIRRGRAEKARQCAHAVMGIDSDYLWRRLCVIALEDIGWGNPDVCAMVLAVATNKKFRATHGEKPLLFFLVDMLAGSIKDRTLCDFVNVWHHTAKEKLTSDKTLFNHSVINSDMPFVGKYMAVKGRMALKIPLWLPVQKQWNMLKESEMFGSIKHDVAEQDIYGIPASAYDQHTMVGKKALAYFAKACDPIREWFVKHPFMDKVAVLGGIVFVVEGARLDRQLDFDWAGTIYDDALISDFHHMNGASEEDRNELIEAVRKNLEALNKARVRVSTPKE